MSQSESNDSLLLSDMIKHVKKIQLTSETKELRHLQRVLRYTFSQYRRKKATSVTKQLIETFFPIDNEFRSDLISLLEADVCYLF